jgi:hypothetical protein
MMDEIVAAIEKAEASWREPEHPQYDKGVLYVSPQQYAGLRRWADAKPLSLEPPPPPIFNIEVRVLKHDDPVHLSNGRVLIYSSAMEHIYVFDKSVWDSVYPVKPEKI